MEFNLFICHASEDKDFVDPLAQLLQNEGYSVWYDKFQLKLGDSISEKIDYGLAKSRFGLVVLSPSFFSRNWTRRWKNKPQKQDKRAASGSGIVNTAFLEVRWTGFVSPHSSMTSAR